MVTPTDTLSIDDAAVALDVTPDALLDEVRNAAAAAERPSARD